MSTDYSILLEQYPEVVSKDQMYKICHIMVCGAAKSLD